MTDKRAALVERMQMALWDEPGERISDEAMATIVSLVMEEAAKVADKKEDEWTAKWRKGLKVDSHLEGMSDGASEIAAAIRAMIPHD